MYTTDYCLFVLAFHFFIARILIPFGLIEKYMAPNKAYENLKAHENFKARIAHTEAPLLFSFFCLLASSQNRIN